MIPVYIFSKAATNPAKLHFHRVVIPGLDYQKFLFSICFENINLNRKLTFNSFSFNFQTIDHS